MTKTRKTISIILAAIMCMSSIVPAFATGSQESETYLLCDSNFIQQATITKTETEDDVYEYEFVYCENNPTNELTILPRSNEVQKVQSTAKIIAFDEETAKQIESNIQSISGSPTVKDWFFEDSVYMEVTVNYTEQIVGLLHYYRINSVTTLTRVNSGTTLTSRNLACSSVGSAMNSTSPEYFVETYDIFNASNPYTTTVMASRPYICSAYEGHLGASLSCNAQRPSGKTELCELANNVF